MKQYEYVDEYIATNCEGVGAEFNITDYRAWMDETYPSQAHKAGMQLMVHRQAPGQRVFTTECLRRTIDSRGRPVERAGMGPNAFYRVIETGRSVAPSSVLRMHLREAQEMVGRWENEARFRMKPVALRNKRADRAFEMARAEAKAVALMLHARMRYFDGEDEDEE